MEPNKILAAFVFILLSAGLACAQTTSTTTTLPAACAYNDNCDCEEISYVDLGTKLGCYIDSAVQTFSHALAGFKDDLINTVTGLPSLVWDFLKGKALGLLNMLGIGQSDVDGLVSAWNSFVSAARTTFVIIAFLFGLFLMLLALSPLLAFCVWLFAECWFILLSFGSKKGSAFDKLALFMDYNYKWVWFWVKVLMRILAFVYDKFPVLSWVHR